MSKFDIGRFLDYVAIPAAVIVLLLCGAFAVASFGVYILSFV